MDVVFLICGKSATEICRKAYDDREGAFGSVIRDTAARPGLPATTLDSQIRALSIHKCQFK